MSHNAKKATRRPTAEEIQESTQLYNDINAIFTKLVGPQARIENHRPFDPPREVTQLEPSTFYSFILMPVLMKFQNEVGKSTYYTGVTVRDGESYFAVCTPLLRGYDVQYEKDPITFSVLHILTLNTELIVPIPWRANLVLTLIAKKDEPYSIVTIPEDANIADEDVDNYVATDVKSKNLKEQMRVGLRQRVVINVQHKGMIHKWASHHIRIIVASNETSAPVILPESEESVSAFPPTTQGHKANPPPAATITSQTQHQYPYIGQTQQRLGQQPPYVPPPAWPLQGTSSTTFAQGLQEQPSAAIGSSLSQASGAPGLTLYPSAGEVGPPSSAQQQQEYQEATTVQEQEQSIAQYFDEFATSLQNWEFEQQDLPDEGQPPLMEEDAPGQANEGAAIGLSVPPAWPMQGPPQQALGQQPPYVPPPAWAMPGTSHGPPPSTSGRGLQQQLYSAPSAAIGSSLSQASGASTPPLHPPAGRGGLPSTAQQEYQQPTTVQEQEQSIAQYLEEFATGLQNWEFEQQHLPDEGQPPLMEEDATGQANEGAAIGSSVPPAWSMQSTPQQRLGQQPPYVPPPAWPLQGLQEQPSAAIGSSLSQASGAPTPPLYVPVGGVGLPSTAQQEQEFQHPIGSPSMSQWLNYSMGINDEDDGGENQ